MIIGQTEAAVCGCSEQLFLHFQAVIDFSQQSTVVEICIGDGSEECIDNEVVDGSVVSHSVLEKRMVYCSYTTCDTKQQVHPAACLRFLTTHTANGATSALGCFLTLKAKHLILHNIILLYKVTLVFVYC